MFLMQEKDSRHVSIIDTEKVFHVVLPCLIVFYLVIIEFCKK